MLCAAGRRNELSPQLMESLGRYRHQVFISHLGWPLPSTSDIESDEFDGPQAVYVAADDGQGQINGVARLLPTTVPYLLEGVFPGLWGGAELPRQADIWELSRFASVDFSAGASLAHQASATHTAEFFRHVVQVAKQHGARQLLTVSPVGMERLMRALGFRAVRAGVPMLCDGAPIVALMIDCEKFCLA